MIEERRADIEREIENLKYYRKVLRKLYYKLDGVIPEVVLADIVSDIYLLEGRIVKLRTEKQLIDKAHEEALCKAADKTLQEYADIAAGRDLESTAKRFEEARAEHGTPSWKVGALMQESPAKKQRKSLVRAIINLLDTKYK